MALREEEFERLQTQLLELKTCNYSLSESVARKDAQILQLQNRTEELEKELNKMQSLAKLNPLAFARSLADRKEAQNRDKDRESLQQLMTDLDQLNSKMEVQEEEFRRTNETLKQEIYSLMNENEKLRQFAELSDEGRAFVKNLNNSPPDVTPTSSPRKVQTCNNCDCDADDSNQTSAINLLMENEKLTDQLLELQQECEKVTSERNILQTRVDELTGELQSLKVRASESFELAENRKSTIDEMKMHIEESKLEFEKKELLLKEKQNELTGQLSSLSEQIRSLETQLEDSRAENSRLTDQIKRLDEQVAQVAVERDQIRSEMDMTKEYYERKISEIEKEHENMILLLQETHSSEICDLKSKLEESDGQVAKLKQAAEDSIEERKIHERKAVMMMKELKKNLSSERKRAERLQLKLQEFLSTHTDSDDLQILNHPIPSSSASTPIKSPTDHPTHSNNNHSSNSKSCSRDKLNDTASVGSWSFMSRNGNENCSGAKSAVGSNADSNHSHSNGSNSNDASRSDQQQQTRRQELEQSSPSSSSNFRSDQTVQQQQQGSSSSVQMERRDTNASATSDVISLQELECENEHLVSRISDLQQEKWQLEERINQLLTQVDQLTRDNQSKGSIIEFYCMGGDSVNRSVTGSSTSPSTSSSSHHLVSPHAKERITVRKVVDFIKDRGDENLKEINRKLQRMLEETLTKNMYLQKDLEHLSNEIVRLSKTNTDSMTK